MGSGPALGDKRGLPQRKASGSQRWVTTRFLPLTAKRMLKQSLEKMRLLSVSLGPLMCRTLDHLLCPARTCVVRCSVRPRAGIQPEWSCWEPWGTRGRASRALAPTALKHGSAVLRRLTAAQAAIGSDPGPRSARATKKQRPKPVPPVQRQNKQVRRLQSPSPVTGNPKDQACQEQP